jgi:hypothetical protein
MRIGDRHEDYYPWHEVNVVGWHDRESAKGVVWRQWRSFVMLEFRQPLHQKSSFGLLFGQ